MIKVKLLFLVNTYFDHNVGAEKTLLQWSFLHHIFTKLTKPILFYNDLKLKADFKAWLNVDLKYHKKYVLIKNLS